MAPTIKPAKKNQGVFMVRFATGYGLGVDSSLHSYTVIHSESLPYMTERPLSWRNLNLLCLNNHIVSTVNVSRHVYTNKLRLSIRWFNCAFASSSMSAEDENKPFFIFNSRGWFPSSVCHENVHSHSSHYNQRRKNVVTNSRRKFDSLIPRIPATYKINFFPTYNFFFFYA